MTEKPLYFKARLGRLNVISGQVVSARFKTRFSSFSMVII